MQNLNENCSELEEFLICALIDLESIKSLIGNETLDIANSVFSVFPKTTHHLIVQTMKINKKLLEKHLQEVQTAITNMKYKECMAYLSKVESIPRLYRRTNRSFPQEPSNYVLSAVDVLLQFNLKHKDINSLDAVLSTVNIVVEQTSSQ